MFPRRLSVAGLVIALAPLAAHAQVSPQDRAEILQLQALRGAPAGEFDPLFAEIEAAGTRGLPSRPLVNKIKEGVAKGVPAPRIGTVVRDMAGRLDSARALLDGRGPAPQEAAASRARGIELIGEALGRGVTRDDILAIDRIARERGTVPNAESLASAAKGLAILKEGGFALPDSRSLVGEALREGFRPVDLLDLARDLVLQRRERPEHPPSLQDIRDGIARGERIDRLLPPERPPDRIRPGDGPSRPDRPETSDRPETPDRPDRPERGERGKSGRQ